MNDKNYRIHLLYWAIIFVIMTLFLILCVPGKINEDALSNFSFASVLVSIVLAVISIVLSISVGQATTHYNREIKDVENEIQEKLKKFDDLEGSIRSSVESIVRREVGDVKKGQNEMKKTIETLMSSANTRSSSNNTLSGSLNLSGASNLCVSSLYLASLCYKTNKPLPLSQLKHSAGIIVGFLNALSTVEPDNILIEVKDKDVYVKKFSYTRWGQEVNLKNAVENVDNIEIKDIVIEAGKRIIGD